MGELVGQGWGHMSITPVLEGQGEKVSSSRPKGRINIKCADKEKEREKEEREKRGRKPSVNGKESGKVSDQAGACGTESGREEQSP